ncbi:MAG: SOUL family heme-binding protein, partial [bacterium]
ACSVVGVRALEEPGYHSLLLEGNFVIREYASFVVAEVFMEGEDFDEASGDGFRILADYIFGNNLSRSSAVQMAGKAEAASENIAMTAPVQMDQGEQPDQWRMAFSLPSKWNLETAPVPNDQRVKLREVLPERMVVLQFSGRMGAHDLEEKEQELRQWATKQGITVVGSVRTARYDPPWTLPFLRKNEVQLKVEE